MKARVFYIITTLSLTVASVVTSCKKDFLNTVPNDRLSGEFFWKTEDDAKLAVNAIYPSLDAQSQLFLLDGLTDIAHVNRFFEVSSQVEQNVYDASSSLIADQWSAAYKGIAAANFVLDNINKIPETETNNAALNQYKGEAKTLRAYQYIKLASLFGDVPLVTKQISIQEGKQLQRAPINEVWDFIDKELKEAVELLPPTIEKGRITRGAAWALNARANLYAGRYQDAVNAAQKVFDLNLYSLYPDYEKLFSYSAEGNEEIILDRQFLKDVLSNNVFSTMAPYSQATSNNFYVPTKAIADMYPMNNGLSISDINSGFDKSNPYENRDPRMHYSMFIPGDILPNGKVFNPSPNSGTPDAIGSTFNATSTGYTIKKYINNEDLGNPSNNGINSILIRYAEVLLTYAEAKIELDQIDNTVFHAINQIRQRSDVNLPPLSNALNRDQLRETVRRERTLELAFEGFRMFDIRRWKIAETVIPGSVYGITYLENGQLQTIQVPSFIKGFNKNRDYLWPIPQNEKILNPNLGQNPNW